MRQSKEILQVDDDTDAHDMRAFILVDCSAARIKSTLAMKRLVCTEYTKAATNNAIHLNASLELYNCTMMDPRVTS